MSDEPVNTGQNRKPGTFVKGDARINRKGRPRSFEAFRKLAVKIAGEQAEEDDITRAVKMLRDMARSNNPADRALFLAYAFGKPKESIDLTSAGNAITFIVKQDDGKDDQTLSETV